MFRKTAFACPSVATVIAVVGCANHGPDCPPRENRAEVVNSRSVDAASSVGTTSQANDATRNAVLRPRTEAFSVRGHDLFKNTTAALLSLVRAKRASANRNHFCIVGYGAAGADAQAWVHWREDNALILWEPHVRASEAEQDLVDSRRYYLLDRDVVDADGDLGASTYLVTTTWVRGILGDCAEKGDTFLLKDGHVTRLRK